MITSSTATAADYDATAAEERPDWFPLAAGGALALLALSKRSTLLKLAAVVGGGYLLYRAAERGSLRLPPDLDSLRLPSDLVERFRSQFRAYGSSRREGRDWYPPEAADKVDEASMESFPGSDPPANY